MEQEDTELALAGTEREQGVTEPAEESGTDDTDRAETCPRPIYDRAKYEVNIFF